MSGSEPPPPGTSSGPTQPVLTPEIIRDKFLQVRQWMNDYVRSERANGICMQLSFDDESIVMTSHSQPQVITPTSLLSSLARQHAFETNSGPSPLTQAGGHSLPSFSSMGPTFFTPPPHTTPLITQTGPFQSIGESGTLSLPCKSNDSSKFTPRIANFACPPKTKMLPNMRMYDGSLDLEDHISLCDSVAQMDGWMVDAIWCHVFIQTLSGTARLWFNSMSSQSIDNFEEMKTRFLVHFQQQQKHLKYPVEIHNI
jgi:hypothetical protein